jgi:hypothetical protein
LFIAEKYHHPVSTRTLHGQRSKFVKKESILHCPVERQYIVENNLGANGIFKKMELLSSLSQN